MGQHSAGPTTGVESPLRPATYLIRVEETLQVDEAEVLLGMAVVEGTETGTVLRGDVADASALVGTLRQIESLGCTVRDFSVVDADPQSPGREQPRLPQQRSAPTRSGRRP